MPDIHFMHAGLRFSISVEKFLTDNCGFRYSVHYQKDQNSELNGLCERYGSDKGELTSTGHPYPWPSHNYADLYEGLFGHCRDAVRTVFECGLGTNNPDLPSSMGASGRPGASLRVWRDYFPNAHVYGADIDRNTLFQEERISTYYVDQTSAESVAAMWRQVPVETFDFMIDDGLHTYQAGVTLFENSFHKLRKGGIYAIEDITPPAMISFRSYFGQRGHRVEFVDLTTPPPGTTDNAMILIRK